MATPSKLATTAVPTVSVDSTTQPAAPQGLFIVDLQGLQLTPSQLSSIELAIQGVVEAELAKIDDREGVGGPLGGVMGFRAA